MSDATALPPGPEPGSALVELAAPAAADRIELAIARTLSAGAVLAVGLLLVGIVLMLGEGISPDAATYPVFDPSAVVADLLALRPAGFLWAGILVVIATPILRVVGELVGYGLRKDRAMTMVAAATLLVIVVSVVTALAAEA
jgi:uncharacterized membrane protein